VSEAERVVHRLNAEADRHKQLALDASNVDDRMFHRLMFHLCREAASKTLLAEEDFQLGEQLEEAWEDEDEEEERAVSDLLQRETGISPDATPRYDLGTGARRQ
jgi:hypothetical protein